jgi:hypothetical protein
MTKNARRRASAMAAVAGTGLACSAAALLPSHCVRTRRSLLPTGPRRAATHARSSARCQRSLRADVRARPRRVHRSTDIPLVCFGIALPVMVLFAEWL